MAAVLCADCGKEIGSIRQVWQTDAGPVSLCSDRCLDRARIRSELTEPVPEAEAVAVPDVDALPVVPPTSAEELEDRGVPDDDPPSTLEKAFDPDAKPARRKR